jgi:hypothetical protein
MALALVTLIAKRAIKSVLNAKVPPYQPVDNAPPSDGSSPDDGTGPRQELVPPDEPGGYPGGGGG